MKKVKEILVKIKNFFVNYKFVIGGILLISTLVVPVVSYPLFGRFETKLNEKREKNERPKKLSDDFGKEFDAYYDDIAPYRDSSINLYRDIDFYLASLYSEMAQVINNDYYLTYADDIILGKDRWLFYLGEDHDMLRDNLLSEEAMQLTYDIDRMIKDIEKMGKKVAFLICPNKSTVYSEYLPKKFSKYGNQVTLTKSVQEHFEKNGLSKIIYSLDNLMANKEKEQLYLKFDSHYNEYGAFINYQMICDYFGDEVGEYSFKKEYKKVEQDLTSIAGISPKDDNIFTFDYKPNINIVDEETIGYIDYYTSDNPNNRKLAIIGDSYKNALKPFLLKDYTHTAAMHIDQVAVNPEQYLDKEAFLEADTVVFVSVERFFSIRFVDQEISNCAPRVIADYIENNYLFK